MDAEAPSVRHVHVVAQLLHRLGAFLDDDKVEVLELHPQPGDRDLVGEALEAQVDGASTAPAAHRPAQGYCWSSFATS
ncbi:hypothetical protein KMT30_35430 [Streptomyces sp. IBSBF 2953]|nr:hypothetical protein [Streptomyces hayashii]